MRRPGPLPKTFSIPMDEVRKVEKAKKSKKSKDKDRSKEEHKQRSQPISAQQQEPPQPGESSFTISTALHCILPMIRPLALQRRFEAA